jgi:UDP-N-acetylmuramyl tripeptide synthase
MTRIRLAFALIVSKIAIALCRLLRWGGTTLPGRVARFLYPDIDAVLASGFCTIMVTGTNGKTTTTRIIGQVLAENGIGFVTNRSGANMPSGIASTLVGAVDLRGRSREEMAVLEVDEAAFRAIAGRVKPKVLVVTNFFRDQLDRYGELYSTLSNVREGIAQVPDCKLVLNADDSLCASLGREPNRDALHYGFDATYRGKAESTDADALFCIFCKTRYEYENHVFGHLGTFRCPNCGYARPEADVACAAVVRSDPSFTDVALRVRGTEHAARVNLPGVYNVYNAMAAIAAGEAMGLPTENSLRAVERFEGGFGRMETVETDGRTIHVILVKNPTGFNQVLRYLLTDPDPLRAAFAINDNFADGTDISWLWDVDFETIAREGAGDRFFASGKRAEDMAVRLKYAGVPSSAIALEKDYGALLDAGLAATPPGGRFYLLPTYTSMLDLRKVLVRRFCLKEFWR